MTKLTALNVENWKPSADRQEILDRDGLYFIVQPSGHKSWSLRYRRKGDGVARKYTIGDYPAISLKAARSEATRLRAEIERGADPQGDKTAARRQATEADDGFMSVAKRYIADLQRRGKRSWRWSAGMLGLRVGENSGLIAAPDGLAARWGARRITQVVDSDIIRLLDEISDRPIKANRTHAVLHGLFAWAKSKRLVTSNPLADIDRPATEKSRERVLTDEELRKIWLAAGELGHPPAGIVQFLVFAGERRSEIAHLRWSELDLDGRVIRLPAARTKNARAHDVPLSAQALAIVASLPRQVDSDHVFTVRRRPITNLSHMKDKLHAASGVTNWT